MARKYKQRLVKYENSLSLILDIVLEKEKVSLQQIKEIIEEKEGAQSILIPDIDIFKEIMVELIKSKEIDVNKLRKEKSEYIVEQTYEFQLSETILNLLDNDNNKKSISKIFISRTQDTNAVEFFNVLDENGNYKTIRCSNVEIEIEM